MKLFSWGKDGGPESKVSGLWLVEIKSLFSVVLLRFDDGSREAYHSHAFNSMSWLFKGLLLEKCTGYIAGGNEHYNAYAPSWLPIITRRTTMHQVVSFGTSWVISFRGPWSETWIERLPGNIEKTLTNGRTEI